MTSPRGGAFTLQVERTASKDSLVLSIPNPVTVVWRAALAPKALDAAVDHLRATLEHIHDIAGDNLTLDAKAASQAVDALTGMAPALAYGLFRGKALGELYDVARLTAPAALDPARPPRIVEVCTPQGFAFPFELLPWRPGDPTAKTVIRARRLLGMSAIVRRRFDDQPGKESRSIENHPRLPVTLFLHEDLVAASKEARYLQVDVGALVEVHGPWPKSGHTPPEKAAVRHLLNSTRGVDGTPREPVEVLHLACHCDTKSASVSLHHIDLGLQLGMVAYNELTTEASEPEAWGAPQPRPLVFLNACGSAAPQLVSRTSFTEFFLEQGCMGVVGTLCDISDEVAAHFAAVFYEALLRGRSVGEAMYDARWHLMDRHCNPLGLLYTFHGNPDLRLAVSREGRVVPACEAKPRAC